MLDVGLSSTLLGLNLHQLDTADDITLINNGGIAEQVVGQLLRTLFPHFIDPLLFCWMRETPGSNAELDYIIQHNNKVIPVEVKAGKTGTLKSLHFFMGQKQYDLALRVNSDYPSMTPIQMKDTTGSLVEYRLLSIPFYLLGQVRRLLDAV